MDKIRSINNKILNLKEMIEISCNTYMHNTAIIYNSTRTISKSYIALYNDIMNLGAGIKLLDIQNNAKIVIVCKNSYEWIIAYLCTVYGLGTAVIIDCDLEASDIIFKINHSGADLVFYSKRSDINEIKENTPDVKSFISTDEEQSPLYIYNLIENGSKDNKMKKEFQENRVLEYDLATINYTSGTTGNPKGVELTHRNILSVIKSLYILERGCRYLSVLPMSHVYECVIGVLTPLYEGKTICLNTSKKNLIKDMQFFKPDTMLMVPALLEYIFKGIKRCNVGSTSLEFTKLKNSLGGNLKYITCGSAFCDPFYVELCKTLQINLYIGYGITECSPLVSVNTIKYFNLYSIGKAVPCCEVRIKKDFLNDKYGEIQVRGDNVTRGYYQNEQATISSFEDRWFKTGDIGYVDDDGFLFITGRLKNLLVLKNGMKVVPEELELKLKEIHNVEEVLVYLDDNKSIVTAEIFSHKINDTICQQIYKEIDILNKSLPLYKRINNIKIRQEPFVKTSLNKIKRG